MKTSKMAVRKQIINLTKEQNCKLIMLKLFSTFLKEFSIKLA